MANPYKKPWTETVSNRRAGCIERVHVRFGKGWSGTYLQRQRTGRLLHHTFKLKYLDKAGKKLQGHFYTPDFLVLRKNGVFLEEWKMEEELHKLATKQPYRYQRSVEGQWLCPPGDELTQPLGFSFRVCSSALLPRTYVDNLDFLTDYFISQPVIPERLTTLVRERVQAEPGITIGMLVGDIAGLRPHDLYALIAQEQIFADLHRCILRDHYRTHLFADQPTALAYAQLGMVSSSRTGSIAEPVTAPIATHTRLRLRMAGSGPW